MHFFAALTLVVVSTSSFEDTQKRFSLSLPSSWSFAPQPGDIHGASFRSVRDKRLAHFVIKMIPGTQKRERTIQELQKQWSEKERSSEGYRELQLEKAAFAGLVGLRHRFSLLIDKKSERRKMVENWYALGPKTFYVLRAESLEEDFANFENDFASMVQSLRFKGVKPDLQSAQPQDLVGYWLMDDTESIILALKNDGTFDLDGVVGVWRVNRNEFWSRPLNGEREILTWSISDNTLSLQNKDLPEAMSYTRLKILPPLALTDLFGLWSKSQKRLQLHPDGSFAFNKAQGTFLVTPERIYLKQNKPHRVFSIPYELDEKRLTVSGTPFGTTVVFKKKPSK